MRNRTRKPFAAQRLRISPGSRLAGYRTATIPLAELRADVKRWRHPDKYGRSRAFILRPGRFFYCPECGARMSATMSVLSWNDREYLACIACTEARGHHVWTGSEVCDIPGGAAAYRAAGVEFYR